MAESDRHYMCLADAAYGIRKHLAGRDDVYVGSNLLVYDEPGNPRRHLSPDIFVAFGVRRGPRDLYKIWEERPPTFVLEITSASTRREDERTKRRRYARWGVREYFLYDPRGEWLAPALQGFVLSGERYRRMREVALANGERGLRSESLGLGLWLNGADLRLFDAATGSDLPTPDEEARRADRAERRADRAEQRVLEMLARQVALKFDDATASRLSALLERATDTENFARVGEWLLQAQSADELLARVEATLRASGNTRR